MQRLTGVGKYETAWYMIQKIRKAMRERNQCYLLEGITNNDVNFDNLKKFVLNNFEYGNLCEKYCKIMSI